MKSKVYFTRIITPEKVLEMYEVLGKKLIGKIAVIQGKKEIKTF